MAINFKVFGNLTTALMSYLDDNFNAINSALGAASGIATLNASSKLSQTALLADQATNADTLDNVHLANLAGALIYDHTVTGSAVSSIDTGVDVDAITLAAVTLDGNAHGGYVFEFIALAAATGSFFGAYFNNDTTTTDYYSVGGNLPRLVNSGNGGNYKITTSGTIIPFGTGIVSMNLSYTTADAAYAHISTGVGYVGIKTAVSGNNLTRLKIFSETASQIGVGSRLRIWRRK